MQGRCPGLGGQRLTSTLVSCSTCGAQVEMFSDESSVRCVQCGTRVRKEAAATCAKWCKAGVHCSGARSGSSG